jgi:hypothetical protein
MKKPATTFFITSQGKHQIWKLTHNKALEITNSHILKYTELGVIQREISSLSQFIEYASFHNIFKAPAGHSSLARLLPWIVQLLDWVLTLTLLSIGPETAPGEPSQGWG